MYTHNWQIETHLQSNKMYKNSNSNSTTNKNANEPTVCEHQREQQQQRNILYREKKEQIEPVERKQAAATTHQMEI